MSSSLGILSLRNVYSYSRPRHCQNWNLWHQLLLYLLLHPQHGSVWIHTASSREPSFLPCVERITTLFLVMITVFLGIFILTTLKTDSISTGLPCTWSWCILGMSLLAFSIETLYLVKAKARTCIQIGIGNSGITPAILFILFNSITNYFCIDSVYFNHGIYFINCHREVISILVPVVLYINTKFLSSFSMKINTKYQSWVIFDILSKYFIAAVTTWAASSNSIFQAPISILTL